MSLKEDKDNFNVQIYKNVLFVFFLILFGLLPALNIY